MSLSTLPTELYLEIASHLPLRALIHLRSTSARLRAALTANASSLRPPARRALLALWDRAVASPCFLPSRRRVLPHLRPFDREAYLASFALGDAEDVAKLPAEFATWVREWPARAVVGWCWPGLDAGPYFTNGETIDRANRGVWWQLAGANALSHAGGMRPCVYPFRVVEKRKEEGEEEEEEEEGEGRGKQPFVWLEWSFSPRRKRGGRAGDGFGVSVWLATTGDQQHWAFASGHMLVVSGLGPGLDGTVQLFDEGIVEEPEEYGRLLVKEAPDESEKRSWPYRAWCGRNTKVWFRGRSFVDWMHRQLDVLEEEYAKEVERRGGMPAWEWEEWRFREIDSEHMP